MKLLAFLLIAGTLVGCGSNSGGSADEAENLADYSGETEVPTNSPSAVRQLAGEPGIPGSDIPDQFWPTDDGACYRYGQRIVRVVRNGAGEAVSVFSGSNQEQCDAEDSAAAFSTGRSGDPETFFGVVGDLLLLQRTTEEEHQIRIVDLGTGAAVHEAPFEEPVEISEGGLFYGAPAAEFESQEGLNAVGVNCPESGAWFNDSLAVGVSVRTRYDLSSREAELTDDVICIPLL